MRNKVIASAREFFDLQPEPVFIPGQSYIPATAKVLDADDLSYLVDASLDMWLTAGRYAKEFEKSLPGLFDHTTSALLVNSGSSANLIAISSLGSEGLRSFGMKPLEKGDEIITVAAGFPTTVNPIVQNGWTPVFVDVRLDTLNADVESVASAIRPRTRGVVLAHTLGNAFRADLIGQLCVDKGLFLVEDCCDAVGTTIGEKRVGSFGDFATVSFYPAHHMTMGEGGAVLSRNTRLRKIAESLRDWGRDCWCEPGVDNTCGKRFSWKLGGLPPGYDHKYTYSALGYNLKVTDMQAALGCSQLKKVNKFIEARRRNHKQLFMGIRSSKILSERLQMVTATEGSDPSWFGFPVHCAMGIDRNKLVKRLEELRVGTRLLFAGNITKQPAYKNVNFRIAQELINTDAIMERTFWFAVHPGLSTAKIDYIIDALETAIKEQ